MFNRVFASLAVCSVCLFSGPVLAAGITDHQLIIQYKSGQTKRIQAARLRRALPDLTAADGQPIQVRRRFGRHGLVVRLPENMSREQVRREVQRLAADPAIESVQRDERRYPALVPNDPLYVGSPPFSGINSSQWNLFEAFGINAQAAWDMTTGSANTVIAVLDSGILSHRDLTAARILPGYDFISDTFTANDADPGRDSDPSDPGDAVVAGECDPATNDPPVDEDSSWHGTSVTSVIAAESDNGQDIAGIDFNATILPVRVLGKCGGSVSDIADAMRWAVGLPVAGVPDNLNPAKVVNLSLSGAGVCTPAEQAAIDSVNASGAVVVVAAGNETLDIGTVSPANCRGVIVVGATTRSGDQTSFVNSGSGVDLSAPSGGGSDGILVLSNTGTTVPQGDAVALIQGTSFTTAQVSAVAALIYAVDNTLTSAEVSGLLCSTTQVFPAGSTCTTSTCGTGILDAAAAVTAAQNPPAQPAACASNNAVIASSGGGGGGGGGCALGGGQRPDPVWWLLVLAIFWRWSSHKRNIT